MKSQSQAFEGSLSVLDSRHLMKCFMVGFWKQVKKHRCCTYDLNWRDIKKAYRQKMLEYHPDRVVNLGKELCELAEQKTKAINSAYAEALKLKDL
jgi:hypothetical protein